MSTYLGKQLLSGVGTNTIANAHSLFDFKWSDHILNEMSWLRSDTFSWHNGDVYVAAYNHLENDFENGTHAQQEVINGNTIYYCLAEDGHKIVDTTQLEVIDIIYNQVGVAWYYIIDRVNKRFKLPRLNPAREELIQTIGIHGNDMSIGVTDGTDNAGLCSYSGSPDRVMAAMSDYGKTVGESHTSSTNLNKVIGLTKDASKSGMIADLSNTESIYSGNKYLYFYVGDYDTTDITGINASNTRVMSNCLTEIPQDIKLELNNGVLTLKAGSKVYVPNGFEQDGTTPHFDAVTIASDISLTEQWGTAEQFIIAANSTGISIVGTGLNRPTSGPTAPTATNYTFWYDTTSNLIKLYNGGSYSGINLSLPITICTVPGDNTSTVSSIDQIFNGFGYIGSTKFVLPGVSGLIPNGFRSDGSLRNIPFTVKSVLTCTGTSTDNCIGYFNENSTANHKSTTFKYDSSLNLIVRRSDGQTYKEVLGVDRIPFTDAYNQTNGKIASCSFKEVFHALDYSDIPEVTKNILEVLYPVGGVYIGTQNSCPMSILIPGSTWELVSSGKALWTGTGSNANTTIAAGLPNIKGSIEAGDSVNGSALFRNASGALAANENTSKNYAPGTAGPASNKWGFNIDASRSNSIYGNSTTVQPPAYVVNVWRRTA